jgi:hypothetical protein
MTRQNFNLPSGQSSATDDQLFTYRLESDRHRTMNVDVNLEELGPSWRLGSRARRGPSRIQTIDAALRLNHHRARRAPVTKRDRPVARAEPEYHTSTVPITSRVS